MDGPSVLAFAMNAGLLFMLVVPGVAALIVRLRRGSGVAPGRAGARAAEIDDVFSPGRRREIDQMEIAAMLRVDDGTGDDDPLHRFPDPDGLRDQLDPDGVHEERRARWRDRFRR